MKLTLYTDYAMRVMIYTGSNPDRLCSIREISDSFSISQNHLMKVVQDLVQAGFLTSVRGRKGGLKLSRDAADINLGELLRHTEGLTNIIDCSGCVVAPVCGLPPILNEATRAFVAVFDKYSVADLVARRSKLSQILARIA